MNEGEKKEIYDDIVFDYAAIKTNNFIVKHEEPGFWKEIGDVTGQDVLDLACGSGHNTRKLKQNGANVAIGVDISEEMIKEGRNIEKQQPLGIDYYVGDASNIVNYGKFDIVTAQYLFCYANSKEILSKFCRNIYNNLKPGGRLLSTTCLLDESCKLVDMSAGYKIVPCPDTNGQTTLCDGGKVIVTLYSSDFKRKCCFPNFLWKPDTVENVLRCTGFSSIKILPVVPGDPRVIISATRMK